MWVDVLTLFPASFFGPLQESMIKRAQQRGLLHLVIHQIRDYALDRHQMSDDIPYGGGEGMVMKPEPLFRAVRSILKGAHVPIILLTPQGRPLTHTTAQTLAKQPRLLFICGHYEGVDERVRQYLISDEISIGDYVLTGGELAAMVVIDAVARFVPGVLGAEGAAHNDSYAEGLLEGPQYTRPPVFETYEVPEVVRSGNHALIARWKRDAALRRTWERRPELLSKVALSDQDKAVLEKIQQSSEPNDV